MCPPRATTWGCPYGVVATRKSTYICDMHPPGGILQKMLVIGGKMGIMLSLDKKWFKEKII